ncbi:DUF3302 domain-containing protein [Thalassotalea sp. PLHSN55]|uniref:DUF3302 domain-containing protein n=1 Tax=Thalassotalea sp. PLHSN55 TaxID=3435888 RepID=UPI003F87B25F
MLDYIALFILIIAALILFYGIIVIHDIPYEIAEKRQHPHADAIHIAGWVSLLTLHVLWPFLWIWSTLYRKDRGWGFSNKSQAVAPMQSADGDNAELANDKVDELSQQVSDLLERVATLETQLSKQQATNVQAENN